MLSEANLFIDDTPAMSPGEVRARARRIKRKHGLGLVVIDYLQLMQSDYRTDNRVQEVSYISRNLKTLARELNVPVLAAAQEHGLAPLLGSSPTVGAIGYTLGGGLGYLSRKGGLTIDNMLECEVVLANGDIVTANAE